MNAPRHCCPSPACAPDRSGGAPDHIAAAAGDVNDAHEGPLTARGHAAVTSVAGDASSVSAANTVVIRPSVLYFGTPVVLVTTRNPDGSTNVAPMSSAWALDDRVVLGIGDEGQTIRNLRRERECVLNVPSPAAWRAVEALASTTGREDVPAHKRVLGFHYERDKLGRAGLTALASEVVRPPRLRECPLQLEAELVEAFARRGRRAEEGFVIVETRVVRVHAHRDIVVPGTDRIDVARYAPLLYVFRHYFGAAGPIGKTFRA